MGEMADDAFDNILDDADDLIFISKVKRSSRRKNTKQRPKRA